MRDYFPHHFLAREVAADSGDAFREISDQAAAMAALAAVNLWSSNAGNDMANAVQLKVNGVVHFFDGDPETPLLWYVRDTLGLTSAPVLLR